MFSFVDGFSGYNDIKMTISDTEKTAFRTPIRVFYIEATTNPRPSTEHRTAAFDIGRVFQRDLPLLIYNSYLCHQNLTFSHDVQTLPITITPNYETLTLQISRCIRVEYQHSSDMSLSVSIY